LDRISGESGRVWSKCRGKKWKSSGKAYEKGRGVKNVRED